MRLIQLGLLAALLFLFVGCAFETPTPDTPTPPPTKVSTAISVQPTNTPVPPPPTPSAVPTAAVAPTVANATAAPVQLITVEMVQVPAGSFMMGSETGSPEAKPAHSVEVPSFKIDQLEVTNADFGKFIKATGYKTDAETSGDKPWSAFAEGKDNHPVVKVTWNDATAFCKWAGKRLPTEAEWEKAARGTDGRTYPWGNDWDPQKVNGKDSGLRGTTAVGSFPAGASAFGLLDMAGNVAEWTADVAKPYPGNTASSKLYGAKLYIVRGGGWFDLKEQLAATYRNSATATTANDDLGFRCAQ